MQIIKDLIRRTYNCIATICWPLRYITLGRKHPKHLSMTAEEASRVLSSKHPDRGQSCLCTNNIQAHHDLHIIVPVYNTAQYVRECLDSIYQQQTHFSFFVSIVDDGSTDNSPSLLDSYHTSLTGTIYYDRTEVIHQSNQGASCARNTALKNIKGRYIMFVDSDDTLQPGAIESLMRAITVSDADIAEGNFTCGTTHGCACGKVYRSELFRHVHFPPGYLFEDTLNVFFLYPVSRKTIQVTGTHYYYRLNPNSLMHSFQGKARAIDSLWVSRRVLSDYFSQGHRVTPQLLKDYLQDVLSTASHFHTLKNEQVMQALFAIHCNIFRKHFANYINDNIHGTSLPLLQKCTVHCLATKNYKLFRAIADCI